MPFDLDPVNEEVDSVSFGASAWIAILDRVGLVIGAGSGGSGRWFFCGEGENPYFNDGAKVSAEDAIVMARCAETEARRLVEVLGDHPQSGLVRGLKEFSAFARASGGFAIF